ncbi:MAG: MBL fold metallo-hydrolase [Caldilinea sp. CFX5]|nr:MBL fold metallo-hydrolase [Caldilinea sp. CFX5]
MKPRVDVLIKPFCLRFSMHQGAPIYYSTADVNTQLDGLEEMLGIRPGETTLFDSNLGFLPVSSSTLIRGKKTILVDPNAAHVGFYGMLRARLAEFDLQPSDIDLVVNTHCHHDHTASNFVVRDKPLVLGEHELETAHATYWPQYVEANFTGIMSEVQVINEAAGLVALDDGVWALHTKGHTPGSISLLVEAEQGRVAIVGDLTMTRDEYFLRKFSHWYSPEQVAQLNASLDRVVAWQPEWVVPGHDQIFRAV